MLNFSRGQRNGLIVLSFLIIIFLTFPFIVSYFKKDYSSSFVEFEEAINKARLAEKAQVEEKVEIKLFDFNPNLASEQDFNTLGLNKKQIKQIQNYLSKGGHFYKKEDFEKIYAIDSVTYSKLERYILIPQAGRFKKYDTKKKESKKHKSYQYKKIYVELNAATVADLQEIKGIGIAFSKRIIKYRDALGGFVEQSQIKEVYGIDEEKYLQIESQIFVKKQTVERIKVNFASSKEFEKHPYFSKQQAKEIVKNKTFNGRYKSLEDFRKRLNFSQEFLSKVKDYIEI